MDSWKNFEKQSQQWRMYFTMKGISDRDPGHTQQVWNRITSELEDMLLWVITVAFSNRSCTVYYTRIRITFSIKIHRQKPWAPEKILHATNDWNGYPCWNNRLYIDIVRPIAITLWALQANERQQLVAVLGCQ